MHTRATTFVLSCLLIRLAPAADLVVEPGNPNAYQTLQAALDAASPGDRILIAAPVQANGTVVRKSVTIEPLGGGRASIVSFTSGAVGGLRIEALTPGLPLTLRRLDVHFYEMAGPALGLHTATAVAGEIRCDDVTLDRSAGFGATIWGGGAVAALQATTVWMRGCRIASGDMRANNGCLDLDGTSGTDALVVAADTLRIEGCELRGSSANHLLYYCCFGTPPFCTGQWPFGGNGGAALRATTRVSLLVDCSLSDGNGGTVEPGPWNVTPTAGAAGASVLGGQTGTLATWAVVHEPGLAGHIGAAHTGRGVPVTIGPAAPLSISGPVTPGTWVDVTVTTPGLSTLLGGIAWGETPSPLGTYWVAPWDALPHPGNGATTRWPLPNVPALTGIPIVLQAVRLFPLLGLDNPSGVAIR